MSALTATSGAPVNLTASGPISNVPGALLGFYVNSTSAGTVVLKDGGAGGTAVSGTITPAAGWSAFPAQFASSAYATLGGTINVTFVFAGG
ncbi:MAG TPA: hypothetical protein VN667_14880 [Burkholderiales bacterium]|nr:hypothetical protein [Burkholderiales bacterium]